MGTSDTLRSVIDAGRSSKRLDELSSARVIGKVALQIHAAQQKAGAGKAVGPITPSCIKLASTGVIKLELEQTSSLGYSAPEQIDGAAGDRRSDVFSLGAVLWEALTYQRLFDAMNDAAVRIAVKERDIVAPAELNANVPAELSAICMRALARNPTDRYQSLKAMAVEIEEFLEEAGYADDDSKIAQYLTALQAPQQKVQITMPPLTRRASSTEPPPVIISPSPKPEKSGTTQPPPSVLKAPAQPAQPAMLGEPPHERAKRASGNDLAAALAQASQEIAKGKDTVVMPAATEPPANGAQPTFNQTMIGVPKLDEWQDKPGPAPHAPPPAAAPVVPVETQPLTPLPPVLPQGSTSNLRGEKSTIAAAVPPQVKVSTTIEAKHVEAKQPALIVDDKPQAMIVEEPEPPKREPAQVEPAKVGGLTDALASIEDNKPTLVDAKPPEIVVPTLVDGKLPETHSTPAETMKATAVKSEAKQADAKKPRAKSESEGKKPRAKSQSEQGDKPHPVGAVTLGPGPRESKDVLAGWGWGTDNHNAIAPDGYVDDDDYHAPAHDPKKTLLYVIGGGLGLTLLVTIIAIGFGGDDKKKKTTAKGSAEVEEKAAAQVVPPPPRETPQPIVNEAPPPPLTPEQEAAQKAEAERLAKEEAAKTEAATVEAAKLEAQQKADAEKLAKEEAAKTEAAKQAQAKLEAQQKADAAKLEAQQKAEAAKLAKAEAAKAEAAKKEQAKLEAQQKAEAAKLAKAEAAKAEAAKREQAKLEAQQKAEAAKLAKAEAAKKEPAKVAKTEAAKPEAAKPEAAKTDPAKTDREAARIAAQQRAEAARVARDEETARKRAEAKARADAAKAAKAEKTVAKADPKSEGAKTEGKMDVETAYRVGLQQFARGDTTGALASLRTSLAGNPNYAPTWRGLGLVFEKMGEKDQARAAYKRYLQLAPGANDAEQIRGRLERLGS